ncbi:MAG: hypothetical protein I8H75_05875 [Myxococcaceae bacterium]|nr:hypothetical protein [Myxococcaceae bacterium]MBH2006843.1 hypothetical protein [Myxococcaceae bacterium]
MKKLLFVFSIFFLTAWQVNSAQYTLSEVPEVCFVPCSKVKQEKTRYDRPPVGQELMKRVGNEPDYEGLKSGISPLSKRAQDSIGGAATVMWQNDPCDTEGTLFLAKLMAYFWPGTPEYQALNEDSRYTMDVLFKDAADSTIGSAEYPKSNYATPQAKCIAEVLRAQKGN